MKVRQFYNKNQFVITDYDGTNNTYYLQSYDSIVAKIDKKGLLTFGTDWNYSKTTLKHLYLFLHDYKNAITTNYLQYGSIIKLNTQANKKAYLQKLIDNKTIKVDNNL